ncbi:hypothetical protein BH23BAC1_BH23BAC1_47400 [soil metagenome]
MFPYHAIAQKEANVWYFGRKAGLDFNTGSPVPIHDGEIWAYEGVSTIADNEGQLLFYSDGIRVWNKNHQVMNPDQLLMGHASSTQSGVIVPQPNSQLYYIFTVDAEGGPNGLRYSIVDISRNNGLGEIVSYNNLLKTPMAEKITAVRHENNQDIWVIAHEWNTSGFIAYLVTENGIQPNPVFSFVGAEHKGGNLGGNNSTNAIGQMKVSSDGQMLALAIYSMRTIEIFKFNNSTGKISNTISLTSSDFRSAYGIEFSPDASKLYLSTVLSKQIFQFNLENFSHGAINASARIVADLSEDHHLGALQLAPDGKIYVARVDEPFLGVIDNPNETAMDILFIKDAVLLDNGSIQDIPYVFRTNYGLPNFIQSYFYNYDFTFTSECVDNGMKFELESSSPINSVLWNFGDPASGDMNQSSLRNPVHAFTEAGLYEVSLTVIFNDGTKKTELQEIKAESRVKLGGDVGLCLGDSITFNVSEFGDSFLWQDGSTEPAFTASFSGTYWVEVISNGCKSKDWVNVEIGGPVEVDLGDNLWICNNNPVILNASTPYSTYTWSNGSDKATLEVVSSGKYWVSVHTPCGVVSDTVEVNYAEVPEFDLGEDISLCIDESIILNAYSPAAISYLWSDGSTNSSILVEAEGNYWVEVTGEICVVRDSINIGYDECPEKFLIPNVITPNNDGYNETFVVQGIKPDLWILEIFNRWGEQVIKIKGYNNDWGAEGIEAGTYYFHLFNPVTGKGHKGWVQVMK